MSKFDKCYIIASYYAKLLVFSKKICKNYFFAKSRCTVKMFANKNVQRIIKYIFIYIFEKPLTMPFQICKILNNLMCIQE